MAQSHHHKPKLSIKSKETSLAQESQKPAEGLPYALIVKGYCGSIPRLYHSCEPHSILRRSPDRGSNANRRLDAGNSHPCPIHPNSTRRTNHPCGRHKDPETSAEGLTGAAELRSRRNRTRQTTCLLRVYRLPKVHLGSATKGALPSQRKGNLAWLRNFRR